MNYQVLARRYRPRRFEEVVGQESIAATLRGGIQQDRVAHAYLFAGPRGVGKTSMARIFAKALNCPEAADRSRDRSEWGSPCDRCSTCESIHLGQDIDVVELDGASHRGIDDIRGIIEGVNRPATRSPFKVYIIDEVHMLTREAFNALLKTLEEPPSHVKFVFATTEAHRIPETVQSRCQRFDFHPIGEEAIARRLSQILEAEGRRGEAGLVERIARYGKGGLRDAQSLLDQLMTFSEEELRLEDLDRITGRLPEDAMARLSGAVLGGDAVSVLDLLRDSFDRGADPSMILEQMVETVRDRLREAVRASAAVPSASSAVPPRGREAEARTGAPSVDRMIGALQILLESSARLKSSPFAEISVEVTLLKLARLEDPRAIDEVLRALAAVEARSTEEPPRATRDHAPVPTDRGRYAPEASLPAGPPAAPSAPAPPGRGKTRAVDPGADSHAARRRPEAAPDSTGAGPSPPPAIERSAASSPGREAVSEPQAVARDFDRLASLWGQIGVEVAAKFPAIAPLLRDTTLAPDPNAPGGFLLECRGDFAHRQLRVRETSDSVLGIVREVTGQPWTCRVVAGGSAGAPGRPGSPPSGSVAGPASRDPAGGTSRGSPGGPSGSPQSGGPSPGGPSAGGPSGGDPSGGDQSGRGAQGGGPPGGAAPAPGGLSRHPVVQKTIDLFHGRVV